MAPTNHFLRGLRQLAAGIALALAAISPGARADTLKVPKDFDTIQEAVDAAAIGDTIQVSKGLYLENVVIATDNLTLQGKGAVIDGQYNGACIQATADGFTLSGFTLVNGSSGVQVTGDDAQIMNSVAETCSDTGIEIVGNDATVSMNQLVGNNSTGVSYSATDPGSVTHIERNTFMGESSSDHLVASGGQLLVERNKCIRGFGGLQIAPTHPSAQSLLSRNSVQDGDGTGLTVSQSATGSVLVERNQVRFVTDIGINSTGDNVTLSRNAISDSQGVGILFNGSNGVIDRNSIQHPGDQGITLNGSGNMVEFNSVQDAGRDGILLTGSMNTLSKNKLVGNLGDGIDITNNATLDQSVDNTLTGNQCTANAHEGIDNSGTDTRIDQNKCLKNGRGDGPDIAGAGDNVNGVAGGDGTLASFTGNVFKTGGETTDGRLDR